MFGDGYVTRSISSP